MICISSVPPFCGVHARALAKQIRGKIGGATLIAGLWTVAPAGQSQMDRLTKTFSAAVATGLAGALTELRALQIATRKPSAV